MADESSHVIRGINWRETFPFTQIFRAFRVAIHPTKLILALVALLALYLGGRILDSLWPVQDRAIPAVMRDPTEGPAQDNEVGLFEHKKAGVNFDELRKARRGELEDAYVRVLRDDLKVETDEAAAKNAAHSGGDLGKVKAELIKRRDEAVKRAKTNYDNAIKNAKDANERQRVEDEYKRAVRTAYADAARRYKQLGKISGQGIFIQFFEYEVAQVNNVVWAVVADDWLGGFSANPLNRNAPGVLQSISNFCVTGPWWLVRYHTTYFVLFLILFSVIWAIFGGAIARIAAVHVARDEKLSLSAALRFSTGKFLSFIFAPIIPLLIVLVVGFVVFLGGLVGNIPGIGPFLVGLFFFLALAAGFVMTLVLLGTGGGFNLMYPTIAVEGSDSFDAISRSFSYVYARPWRMLFYTLVAVLYGALCYLFVRFFLAIMLILTHFFVGSGMFVNVDSNVPIDLWSAMWPTPTGQLTYDIDTLTLSGAQATGAFLVALWVYITICMLGAFTISFYFSANTIIYYLMRREVDATELDDVYLEQSEEEFGEGAAGGVPGGVAVTTTTTTTEVIAPPSPAPGGGAQVFPATGGAENPPPPTTPPPANP
jgi:hypothetical protein